MAYNETVSGGKVVTLQQTRELAEVLRNSGYAYEHPTQQAMLGEPTSNQTPGFGGTFTVSQVTSDLQGHVSGMTDRTITIPNATATTSAAGLMSAADKSKLDGIATGATKYTHPSYTARTGKPTANETPAFGETFTVSQIKSDATGHITDAVDRTITIPKMEATTTAAGLMSAADKSKLNNVAANANNYTHPTGNGNNHIPAGGSSGQILRWGSAGTAVWGADNDTKYNNATTSTAGLMSAADKNKLDGIATGATKYTHPSYTSRTGQPTANASPAFGDSFTVSQITSDATGHVTGATNRTITIPNTVATASTAGLMSAADKNKLDGIANGANAYTHPSYTARTGKPTANALPAFGGSFTVSQITTDATGHVSSMTDRTITIPGTEATSSADGLMSASDKSKLDGIASGAQVNVLESVKLNGTVLTPTNKAINIPLATEDAPGLMSAAHVNELAGKATISNNVTVWVAPDGNDTTGDGSEAKPFATIQKAVDALGEVCVNCTIQLKAGTYNFDIKSGWVIINKNGNITISGADTSNTILNITRTENYILLFRIVSAYVEIKNITINYSTSVTQYESILFYVSNCGYIFCHAVSINISTGAHPVQIFYALYSGEIYCDNNSVTCTNSGNTVYGALANGGTIKILSVTPTGGYPINRGNFVIGGGRIIKPSSVSWGATTENYNAGGFIETY